MICACGNFCNLWCKCVREIRTMYIGSSAIAVAWNNLNMYSWWSGFEILDSKRLKKSAFILPSDFMKFHDCDGHIRPSCLSSKFTFISKVGESHSQWGRNCCNRRVAGPGKVMLCHPLPSASMVDSTVKLSQ